MSRGGNYQKIFVNDDDRESFLKIVGEACEMWHMRIHAYCLMNNHYHLLVETPDGCLGRAMRHLNGIYTQKFNRNHHRDGPLFRGRYKAILIDGDRYLMEVVRYIHMNPAKRRNDVNTLLQYPWSSNSYYLGKRKKPEWLSVSEILNFFSENTRIQKSLYKEFITDKIPEEILQIYSKKRLLPILGDTSFIDWAKKTFLKDKVKDYEIPEANRKTCGPSLERVLEIVMSYYRAEVSDLKITRRGVWNEPRKVAMYLCRQMCGLSLIEIKEVFNVEAYTTVSMSNIKVRNKISVDRGFRKKIEKIKLIINNT